METDKKKQTIKSFIAVGIMIIILILVVIMMVKYQVEGEKNMSFNLSKIIIVSTAEGVERDNSKEKWNLDIYQNNDIYFYIDKNEEYENQEVIKKVSIENIKINKIPNIGEIKIYMPNSSEGRLYDYSDNYLVKDKLEYKGSSKSNAKTLEIGNQGGEALIRFSNTNIGNYISNKDKEIIHNGTLLNKINVSEEDVKFNISFDLILCIDNKQYKTEVELDMPYGNILEEGMKSIEITDFIFKRIK